MSVSALIRRLLEDEVNPTFNIEEAKILFSKLKRIHWVLADAEQRGATDASVEDWLEKLKDVAYEIEDILDDVEMASPPVQLESSEENQLFGPWEKVCSFVTSLCLCFRQVVNMRHITLKMKALTERLDVLVDVQDKFAFLSFLPREVHEKRISYSFADLSRVYGRNSERENLVKMLLSDGKEDGEIQIISIVGIGGVGKTTIAQLVYNDPDVDYSFELRVWISVSDTFDTLHIARRILEISGETSNDYQTLEPTLNKIRKVVQGRKFLLVLDDVWIEDSYKWEPLKYCLGSGAPGSRILVTSRTTRVARVMGATQQLQLRLLSDEDCAAILFERACNNRPAEERESLEEIGFEIAKKCNGLPVAAKIVGGMLAFRNKRQWQNLLENSLWVHGEELGDLYRIMKLSYVDLPPVLKDCFLSCIVFPKDSLIYVDELIRIWMAYGYLSEHDTIDELQSKGSMYVEDLAMRLFFEMTENDENDECAVAFKIQDTMHDFAMYLSGTDYNLIIDGDSESRHNHSWSSLGRIRTFCASKVSEEELPLVHLQKVRVLRITECNLQELPQEVGQQIHLRYLNLSGNPIQELPDTMSDLYHLQTLALENCSRLHSLPKGIRKLVKLRHLLNSGTRDLKQYPQELGELSGLWTLSEFRASRASELGILGNLNELRGSLCIFLPRLNDNEDNSEVKKANLKNKIHLRELELFFRDEEQTYDVVDALQPPLNLQSLIIHGISGKWLSHWIDHIPFVNLKLVMFDGRMECLDLPLFGKLPALEKLFIRACAFRWLSLEFLGSNQGGLEDVGGILKVNETLWFPKLRKLHFVSCDLWEEWEDIGEVALEHSVHIMPCLQELKITDCGSLNTLPHKLLQQVSSLQNLEVISCRYLEQRYNKNEDGSDWDKISQIQRIDIQ